MITSTTGIYIVLAGIGLLLASIFYKKKIRFVFLLSGIVLIVSRISMNELILLSLGEKNQIMLVLGDKVDYTFRNGSTMEIKVNINTIINDTEERLIVEEVYYGSVSPLINDDRIICEIKPFSYTSLEYPVDYYFGKPPKKIRAHGGGYFSKSWLHS
jgi:hypothetical protein